MLRSKRFLTLLGGMALLCLVVATAEATHPRPKGATPTRLSLVPAFTACSSPNRTHGPPLAFPSCNPPAQTSGQATVGTPDANGAPANSSNWLKFGVLVGVPGPPEESDVRIEMELNDVRCVPAGARCGGANASGPADYSGDIRFSFAWRRTDHYNFATPNAGREPATVEDFEIESWVPCAQTASTATGSICKVNTTMNLIIPGSAQPDAIRQTWELLDVTVYDGGPDGDGATTGDNTLFMRPGLFIP